MQLSVGRVAVEKNFTAFLDTRVPGSKVVVGDGPAFEALRKAYLKLTFLGALHGAELAAAYAAADVFVFPIRTGTFGLVNIAALTSGLPVAAYPVPGRSTSSAPLATAPTAASARSARSTRTSVVPSNVPSPPTARPAARKPPTMTGRAAPRRSSPASPAAPLLHTARNSRPRLRRGLTGDVGGPTQRKINRSRLSLWSCRHLPLAVRYRPERST